MSRPWPTGFIDLCGFGNEAPGGIGTFLYSYICGPCAAGDVAEFVEPGSWLFRCCCPCCCCLASDRVKLQQKLGIVDDGMACILTFVCPLCAITQEKHAIRILAPTGMPK